MVGLCAGSGALSVTCRFVHLALRLRLNFFTPDWFYFMGEGMKFLNLTGGARDIWSAYS